MRILQHSNPFQIGTRRRFGEPIKIRATRNDSDGLSPPYDEMSVPKGKHENITTVRYGTVVAMQLKQSGERALKSGAP